jgi:hypothetical protein
MEEMEKWGKATDRGAFHDLDTSVMKGQDLRVKELLNLIIFTIVVHFTGRTFITHRECKKLSRLL